MAIIGTTKIPDPSDCTISTNETVSLPFVTLSLGNLNSGNPDGIEPVMNRLSNYSTKLNNNN